jgi:hypothetical protein
MDLLRTPISLFVPAPDLPVWGAAAQVLVVFGIAEMTLGLRRTLIVGYAGTLAGTLYARHGVEVGLGHLFGLPQSDAYVRDSGPSAAVVALAIVIAWQYRARLTAGLVAAVMIAEEAFLPNLAGAEHLVAIATAATFCLASRVSFTAQGREYVRGQQPRTTQGREESPSHGGPPGRRLGEAGRCPQREIPVQS